MPDFPRLVVANATGEIFDLPDFRAAGRSGREIYPLDPAILIPLPESSRLYFLPQRAPLGFARNNRGAPRRQDRAPSLVAREDPSPASLYRSQATRHRGLTHASCPRSRR